MKMRFKVVYNAFGIPSHMIDMYGQILVMAHNRMAELTDGKYEIWNKEFDDIYKDVKGDDPRYIDFINKKIADVAFETLNKEFSSVMTFSMGKECQLVGHPKLIKGSSIDFSMVPIV